MSNQIPLWNRAKEIVAFAVVDDEDYEMLAASRWHLSHGYARRSHDNGQESAMHRLIIGSPEHPLRVDHIDTDTLNNRRSNLRVVSQARNGLNRRGPSVRSKTGLRGVYQHKPGVYRARIKVDGVLHDLGCHADPLVLSSKVNDLLALHGVKVGD